MKKAWASVAGSPALPRALLARGTVRRLAPTVWLMVFVGIFITNGVTGVLTVVTYISPRRSGGWQEGAGGCCHVTDPACTGCHSPSLPATRHSPLPFLATPRLILVALPSRFPRNPVVATSPQEVKSTEKKTEKGAEKTDDEEGEEKEGDGKRAPQGEEGWQVSKSRVAKRKERERQKESPKTAARAVEVKAGSPNTVSAKQRKLEEDVRKAAEAAKAAQDKLRNRNEKEEVAGEGEN